MGDPGQLNCTSDNKIRQPRTHSNLALHRVGNQIRRKNRGSRACCPILRPTDTNDDEMEEEHGYSPDICQLIETWIGALGVLSSPEIHSMMFYKIIYNHAEHLFPILHDQVEGAIKDAFPTGFFQNN